MPNNLFHNAMDAAGLWIISKFPPEWAHEIGKDLIEAEFGAPGRFSTPESIFNLLGVWLDNRLGLAAGYDKYAKLQNHVRNYGFGWIESGSYTNEGGDGNLPPRLFRDKESGGLINRMGLNCIPSWRAAEILSESDQNSFATSIAKTHNPKILGDDAILDMISSYAHLMKLGIYTMINTSCPNTLEGKTFETPESFAVLNSELGSMKKGSEARPLGYKFSPNLEREVLQELVRISEGVADLYEIGNTLPVNHPVYGKGGLSGPEIRDRVIDNIRYMRTLTDKPILGVGGVSTGEDAYAMIQAGATAVLALNGFVNRHKRNPYAGPKFAHKVNRELLQRFSQR